jgi:hypothetical protein
MNINVNIIFKNTKLFCVDKKMITYEEAMERTNNGGFCYIFAVLNYFKDLRDAIAKLTQDQDLYKKNLVNLLKNHVDIKNMLTNVLKNIKFCPTYLEYFVKYNCPIIEDFYKLSDEEKYEKYDEYKQMVNVYQENIKKNPNIKQELEDGIKANYDIFIDMLFSDEMDPLKFAKIFYFGGRSDCMILLMDQFLEVMLEITQKTYYNSYYNNNKSILISLENFFCCILKKKLYNYVFLNTNNYNMKLFCDYFFYENENVLVLLDKESEKDTNILYKFQFSEAYLSINNSHAITIKKEDKNNSFTVYDNNEKSSFLVSSVGDLKNYLLGKYNTEDFLFDAFILNIKEVEEIIKKHNNKNSIKTYNEKYNNTLDNKEKSLKTIKNSLKKIETTIKDKKIENNNENILSAIKEKLKKVNKNQLNYK